MHSTVFRELLSIFDITTKKNCISPIASARYSTNFEISIKLFHNDEIIKYGTKLDTGTTVLLYNTVQVFFDTTVS